jgi:chromosome segregation ATPase
MMSEELRSVTKAKEDLAAAMDALQTNKDAVDRQRTELLAAQAEKEQAFLAKKQELELELTQMSGELVKVKESLEREITTRTWLQDEHETLQAEANYKAAMSAEKDAQISTLRQTVKTLEDQKAALQDRLTTETESLRQLKSEVISKSEGAMVSLMNEKTALEDQLRDATEQMQQLLAEKKTLMADFCNAVKDKNDMERRAEQDSEALVSMTKTMQDLKEQLQAAQSDAQMREAELADMREDAKRLQKLVDDKSTEIASLVEKAALLEQDIEADTEMHKKQASGV